MEDTNQYLPAPWTLRQALIVILLINLLEMGFTYFFQSSLTNQDNFLFWSAIDALLYIFGVVLFVKLKARGRLADLGLHTRKLLKAAVLGIGTGVLTAGLVLLAGSLVVFVVGHPPQAQTVQEVAERSVNLWEQSLFLALSSILIPFKEELVFRGLVYPAFRDRVGVIWGIMLTAVFFSMVHGSLLRALPLLIGGITLNLVYQRTGSLYSAIIAHGVWNGIMSILSFWG